MMQLIKRYPLIWLLLIILLAIVLRGPTLSHRIWNVDEGINASIATIILNGGVAYKDAVCQRGPVSWYVYALTFLLFGNNNICAIHFVLLTLVIFTTIFIYLIGREVGNHRIALLAAFFFVLTSSLGWCYLDTYAFHTEFCLIFFTSIGSLLFLRGLTNHQSQLLIVLSGAFYGMAFFSKQPAAFDFLSAILFIIFLSIARNHNLRIKGWKSIAKTLIFLVFGFSLISVGWCLFFYKNGAWEDFTFYFLVYNVEYYVPAIPLLHRVMLLPAAVGQAFSTGLSISFVGLVFVLFKLIRGRNNTLDCVAQLFIVLWATLSLLGSAGTGRLYGHYLIQVLPSWSLLSAIAVDAMIDASESNQKNQSEKLIPDRLIIVATLIALTLSPVAIAYSKIMPDALTNLRKWGRNAPQDRLAFTQFDASRDLIRHIKLTTNSDSKIFVWGFDPNIYVQADRSPASRYVYYTFITGLIPWEQNYSRPVPESMDKLILELESNEPVLIIDASQKDGTDRKFSYPLKDFEKPWSFVKQKYDMEGYFEGCAVYRLRR